MPVVRLKELYDDHAVYHLKVGKHSRCPETVTCIYKTGELIGEFPDELMRSFVRDAIIKFDTENELTGKYLRYVRKRYSRPHPPEAER